MLWDFYPEKLVIYRVYAVKHDPLQGRGGRATEVKRNDFLKYGPLHNNGDYGFIILRGIHSHGKEGTERHITQHGKYTQTHSHMKS